MKKKTQGLNTYSCIGQLEVLIFVQEKVEKVRSQFSN